MRYIALAFLLAISHPPASSDCINYTGGFKCSEVDNDTIVGSDQSFITIFDGDLDVDELLLKLFSNATFLHFENSILRFPALESVGNFTAQKIKSLSIVNSTVTNSQVMLHNFNGLEEVKVSHAFIDYQVFNKDFFKNNTQIKVLKLTVLELRRIESNTFDNLPELNYVEIVETFLQTLPENIFKFNNKLAFLILSTNLLKRIPEILYPQSLEILKLDQNQITEVSKMDLKDFKNLTELALNRNFIKHVDEDAFDNCAKIQYISLANNYLQNISERHFQNLDSLEILDLSFNYLNVDRLVEAGIPVVFTAPLYSSVFDTPILKKVDHDLDSNYFDEYDLYLDEPYNYNAGNDYVYTEAYLEKTTTSTPKKCKHKNFESDDEDVGGSGSGSEGNENGSGDCFIQIIAGSERRGLEISLLVFVFSILRM
ncbi:hypothetical protein ACFFRR_000630 [Megaselia abdita]